MERNTWVVRKLVNNLGTPGFPERLGPGVFCFFWEVYNKLPGSTARGRGKGRGREVKGKKGGRAFPPLS